MPISDERKKRQDLIDETPEAQQFLTNVKLSLQNRKVFQGEHFGGIVAGVLSSTGVDSQGEAFEIRDLQALVERVERSRLWIWREHDPLIHPIGRALAAQLFYAPESEKYFVAGLVGYYDGNQIPSFKDVGIDVSQLAGIAPQEVQVRELTADVSIEFNPHEVSLEFVKEISLSAPDYFAFRYGHQYRKGIDSTTILEISLSIWVISNTPFAKAFQEAWGWLST
jgi:hypothetical protein